MHLTWDGAVIVVIWLRAGQFGVLILVGGKRLLFLKCPDWFWGPPNPHFSGYQVGTLSPGVNWLGHVADDSLTPIAETRNEWSCTSTPFVCLHGLYIYAYIKILLK
jgi:hypothetical protein